MSTSSVPLALFTAPHLHLSGLRACLQVPPGNLPPPCTTQGRSTPGGISPWRRARGGHSALGAAPTCKAEGMLAASPTLQRDGRALTLHHPRDCAESPRDSLGGGGEGDS